MIRCLILLVVSATIVNLISCQSDKSEIDLVDYLGGWGGKLTLKQQFQFHFHLKKEEAGLRLSVESNTRQFTVDLVKENEFFYLGHGDNQTAFRIRFTNNEPVAFLRINHHLCYLNFAKSAENRWQATWNPLIHNQKEATLLLSLDRNNTNGYYASVFFREPTFHYLQAQDFVQKGKQFFFTDLRSGAHFTGDFVGKNLLKLGVTFFGETVYCQLRRQDYATWNLGTVPHQAKVYDKHRMFTALTQAIQKDTLERTHAVLVARGDDLIYEAYFDGFAENILHDTRSVAKSMASALIGTAIKNKLLRSEEEKIKQFLAPQYPDITWDAGKDDITLVHLLTMSSGLDAIDFGLNRTSYANEGNYQSSPDWSRFILSAPMVSSPGEVANYGSGSPHLLADILSASIDQPLEFYVHDQLFAPLGVDHYRIQVTNAGSPYFGGGWYISPRDLLKFAQLYQANNNKARGIMTEEWVRKSIAKHTVLENTFDQNEYGYLFWHKTYEVAGEKIASVEARGTGGQYLFVIPDLNLTIVVTSGNYTNGKGFQPERLVKEYVLPALLKD